MGNSVAFFMIVFPDHPHNGKMVKIIIPDRCVKIMAHIISHSHYPISINIYFLWCYTNMEDIEIVDSKIGKIFDSRGNPAIEATIFLNYA